MPGKLIFTLFLSSLFVLPVAAGAIYKTVDANGNTVYTDSPPANQRAEEVDLPVITPLQINSPQKIYRPKTRKQTIADTDYSSLEITSPTHNATVRNNGNLTVSAKLDTALMSGHKFQLFINGKAYSKKQRSPSFKLSDMNRGTHTLEVAIVNSRGKKLETASSTIHVQKAIYRAPVTPQPRS
ncbi:DUF4124 domain-containing protein [Endozoicomonas sp. OPT23]|uniref:DUF4124 domain-containing protein n=1 Tax=Endozoicomonas sp. OPT23 TaxID=2072845 RepID=UPI001890F9BA|nr:DUF4124 domain-containing protein [Endozoicomonas sp. OPT23]